MNTDTGLRPQSPAAALALIRPSLPRCGVTRLAEITHLDRIGIPVAISVRPDSQSLAVDSGKGTTPEASLISAAMESMERFWSEESPIEIIRETATPSEHKITNFPLVKGACPPPDTQLLDWSPITDILSDSTYLVPTRTIRPDFNLLKKPQAERIFHSSTTGLSASFSSEDAVVQALCEVIERDACHIAQARWNLRVLKKDSITSPTALSLIAKIQAAHADIRIVACPSPANVPVFIAYIYDLDIPDIGIFKGYGAHPDSSIAITRAICEAVQARALILSGSREDMNHKKFYANKSNSAEHWKQFRDLQETETYQEATWSNREGLLTELAARLAEAGYHRILVHHFPVPEWCPAKVVRALVPGMEGYWTPHTQTLCPSRLHS